MLTIANKSCDLDLNALLLARQTIHLYLLDVSLTPLLLFKGIFPGLFLVVLTLRSLSSICFSSV